MRIPLFLFFYPCHGCGLFLWQTTLQRKAKLWTLFRFRYRKETTDNDKTTSPATLKVQFSLMSVFTTCLHWSGCQNMIHLLWWHNHYLLSECGLMTNETIINWFRPQLPTRYVKFHQIACDMWTGQNRDKKSNISVHFTSLEGSVKEFKFFSLPWVDLQGPMQCCVTDFWGQFEMSVWHCTGLWRDTSLGPHWQDSSSSTTVRANGKSAQRSWQLLPSAFS